MLEIAPWPTVKARIWAALYRSGVIPDADPIQVSFHNAHIGGAATTAHFTGGLAPHGFTPLRTRVTCVPGSKSLRS